MVGGIAGIVKYIAMAFSIGVGLSLMVISAPVLPAVVYLAILFNVMKLMWTKLKNL